MYTKIYSIQYKVKRKVQCRAYRGGNFRSLKHIKSHQKKSFLIILHLKNEDFTIHSVQCNTVCSTNLFSPYLVAKNFETRFYYWLCLTEFTDCLIAWLTDWLIDWLIHWLIFWLTEWLIGWLTDWLIDWLTDWLIDWLTDWLTDWIDLLTDCLIDWLTELTYWLIAWLTDWLIDLLTHWLIDLCTYWLID